MTKQINWKIGGEAGFGIMTTGLSFAKLAVKNNLHTFDYAEYPSLIRGGHNSYEVIVSSQKVTATKKPLDILLCLNAQTFSENEARITAETIILYDASDFELPEKGRRVNIPLKDIREKFGAIEIANNTILLGASVALMGWDKKQLINLVGEEFKAKGEKVQKLNQDLVLEGYNLIEQNYGQLIQTFVGEEKKAFPALVITGNEMYALAAVAADCRYYSAYPMTPASSVLTVMADWQAKAGIIVRHSEDEIAGVNNALGAAFAGVRASVGTSGGGFALMTESLSFAGVAEIPLVVLLSQRPGPATGMPTWTEQGDLLFAVNGGHGEFPKIVLAPGDITEVMETTLKAFNLADIYQLPVIVLLDKVLSESHESISESLVEKYMQSYEVKRGKLVTQLTKDTYQRFLDTKDGISPRSIPGSPGLAYQANSYEHFQDGHTTESALERVKQVQKRKRKMNTYLETDFALPTVLGNLDKAEVVLVSWGSTKRPLLEAVKDVSSRSVAMLHFTHLYPLSRTKLASFFGKEKHYIIVENNSEAQFRKLLAAETGIYIEDVWLKYNGRPWWREELVDRINNLLKTKKYV